MVKAIFTPNNAPAIEERTSPIVGAMNKGEKSHPFPHKTKQPKKQNSEANTLIKDGFCLVKISMVRGTAITEKLSKNVFLDRLVDSKPMN